MVQFAEHRGCSTALPVGGDRGSERHSERDFPGNPQRIPGPACQSPGSRAVPRGLQKSGSATWAAWCAQALQEGLAHTRSACSMLSLKCKCSQVVPQHFSLTLRHQPVVCSFSLHFIFLSALHSRELGTHDPSAARNFPGTVLKVERGRREAGHCSCLAEHPVGQPGRGRKHQSLVASPLKILTLNFAFTLMPRKLALSQ